MSEDPEALFATARRAILDKRPDLLQELLERTPELARARNESGEDLLNQTLSYANFVGDQVAFWTSTPCAELLIRAGATVAPETCLRAIYTADAEMVQMFLRLKAIPPQSPKHSSSREPGTGSRSFHCGWPTAGGGPALPSTPSATR